LQWRKIIKNLFTYTPSAREPFILLEGSLSQELERESDNDREKKPVAEPLQTPTRRLRKPIKTKDLKSRTTGEGETEASNSGTSGGGTDDGGKEDGDDFISPDLETNRRLLAEHFYLPQNKDVVIRDFVLPQDRGGMIVYIDGIVNSDWVMYSILQPLMVLSGHFQSPSEQLEPTSNLSKRDFKALLDHLLPVHQLKMIDKMSDAVSAVLNGLTVLFMDGVAQAAVVETRFFPNRSVTTPMVEAVVRGPQEAFTESQRVNVALIRKAVRHRGLVTETVDIGENMTAMILYMAHVANPALVAEVKRRLAGIRGSFLREVGLVEQMIEDHPFSIYPQVTTTERPDRAAAMLSEGKVVIVLEGSPFVMIVPTTLFNLIKTPEDLYMRPFFGTFIRLIRVFAIFVAYLLPGVYLAVINHHQALIPTDLLLAIAGAREGVPLPSWGEVLVMELSFEMIREAGIRVPGVVGPTLGILGAIVLGQAAVQAAIVSPILIIVVAITALAAFAVPDYSLQFSTRIIRFIYIVLGWSMGLYGIVLGLAFQLVYTAGLTSFGVGYLSPVAPATKVDSDIVLRRPIFSQATRPDYLQVQSGRRRKQPDISRLWTLEQTGQTGSKEQTADDDQESNSDRDGDRDRNRDRDRGPEEES